MGNIKYLQPEFEGRASCKGFHHSKLLDSSGVFLYESTSPEGDIHYDVFKAILTKPHPYSNDTTYSLIERFPSDEIYGLSAYNFRSLRTALKRFFDMVERNTEES